MSKCPITYEELAPDETDYSKSGLRTLSRRITKLKRLPYSSQDLVMESASRAHKMSIAGVQPKLSAVFSPSKESFQIVDTGGTYILKSQNPQYPMLPENEDLTMKLAAMAGIETPVHGMLLTSLNERCYFINRFDRIERNKRLALEDFAQLTGATRDTKYESSLEKVSKIIQANCPVPLPELEKLLRRVVFSFLVGNEDMHLKNYSLLTDSSGIVRLAPAYDLLSTSIVIDYQEESALPLRGRKSKWTDELVFDYFAADRLRLTERVIRETRAVFKDVIHDWIHLIRRSFLNPTFQEALVALVLDRAVKLALRPSA